MLRRASEVSRLVASATWDSTRRIYNVLLTTC
jgi:hypothetical protein